MIALFVLLGPGVTYALGTLLFDGGSDDDDGGAESRTLDDEDNFVADTAYRGGIVATLDDLVAEDEITQAAADLALDAVVFTSGAQDLATLGGDDAVLAGAGNDRIDAGAGDDSVIGGAGNDRIVLGDGSDQSGSDSRTISSDDDILTVEADFSLFGPDSVTEGGNDSILGGEGDDFIADGFGANQLQGQQGRDVIVAVDQDGLSPDTVDGGFGDDALFVDQGDLVTGSRGNDTVTIDLFGADLDGYQPVIVTDYAQDVDILVLEGASELLLPPAPAGPGDVPADPVTVADVPGTRDAVIRIDGVPVVIVQGGQGLQRADIRINT